MSPRTLRTAAFALGVLGGVARLVVVIRLDGLRFADRFDRYDTGDLGYLAAQVAALAVPLAGFGLLVWIARPYGTLIVHNGGFVAPASPVPPGIAAIMVLQLLGDGWPRHRDETTQALRLDLGGGALGFAAAYALLPLTAAIVLLVLRTPVLRLDPTGFTVWERVRRSRHVPWELVTPGHPHGRARRGRLAVRLNLPPLGIGGYAVTEDVPVGLLHVRPGVVAVAIRHYGEHPEHRTAIGTPAELARLQAVAAGE
ncbi:hypothetical protein [Hamadaea tsunoensis]|uniref:hypothetical protein n=1 Tax=Hamadaea tsunoensis TaxID=53368 RepID=UPI0003FA5D50|nr:hypothetical protein [Hamadaea tsunoensis]